MHIADPKLGIFGANGIVAAGVPIAAGAATAAQLRDDGSVTVAFFGDGAVAQGAFHEAVNLAAVWKLPVIFFCENNGYAEFSPASTQHAASLEHRAAGYGIPYVRRGRQRRRGDGVRHGARRRRGARTARSLRGGGRDLPLARPLRGRSRALPLGGRGRGVARPRSSARARGRAAAGGREGRRAQGAGGVERPRCSTARSRRRAGWPAPPRRP